MNIVKKTAGTLRNHWKKSTFFTVVALWGSNRIAERVKVNKMMRAYCLEAVKFGEEKLHPMRQSRHVTVVLNPTAKKRTAKANYEKYVAPILHCAGLKVSLIQTEAEGQGRELMEIMKNTDAVIIAGGSGTIHEAVTGLLRREDGVSYPLGFIPLGKLNRSCYSSLWSLSEYSYKPKLSQEVKKLAESTMAVVRETVKTIDVLRIDNLDRGKPVFAVDNLFVGITRDILSVCDSFWYLGDRMKPYLALGSKSIFRKLDDLAMDGDVEMRYTDPCSGCSTCRVTILEAPQETKQVETKRWWSQLFTVKPFKTVDGDNSMKKEVIDYSKISNPSCGEWKTLPIRKNLLDFIVENDPNQDKSTLILRTSETSSKGSFVLDGVDARKGHFHQINDPLISFKDLEIKAGDNNKKDRMFTIDGEDYEFGNLRITRIPGRITVYA